MCIKNWPVLLAGLAIMLLMLWAMTWGTAPQGRNWLVLSLRPVGFQTNAGVSLPTAIVRVSNVGPRAVDFRLCWFECRASKQKTLLATNRFASAIIPLSPGRSTNLTMDVTLAGLPLEEYWCCAEVLWAERDSMSHRFARKLDWLVNWLDLMHNPPSFSKELLQGSAIAGNVEVADYFFRMYGKTRSQWLLLAQKMPSIMIQQKNNWIYFPGPSASEPEENTKLQAESAFADFCRTPTNSVPNAGRHQ